MLDFAQGSSKIWIGAMVASVWKTKWRASKVEDLIMRLYLHGMWLVMGQLNVAKTYWGAEPRAELGGGIYPF